MILPASPILQISQAGALGGCASHCETGVQVVRFKSTTASKITARRMVPRERNAIDHESIGVETSDEIRHQQDSINNSKCGCRAGTYGLTEGPIRNRYFGVL